MVPTDLTSMSCRRLITSLVSGCLRSGCWQTDGTGFRWIDKSQIPSELFRLSSMLLHSLQTASFNFAHSDWRVHCCHPGTAGRPTHQLGFVLPWRFFVMAAADCTAWVSSWSSLEVWLVLRNLCRELWASIPCEETLRLNHDISLRNKAYVHNGPMILRMQSNALFDLSLNVFNDTSQLTDILPGYSSLVVMCHQSSHPIKCLKVQFQCVVSNFSNILSECSAQMTTSCFKPGTLHGSIPSDLLISRPCCSDPLMLPLDLKEGSELTHISRNSRSVWPED